jgi:phosphatidate cytidylyltransferase
MYGAAAAAAMPVATAVWGAQAISWCVLLLLTALLLRHTFMLRIRAADTAETLFGAVYIGALLSHLVLVGSLAQGRALLLTVILSVWAADVAAYAFGIAFGKHRMVPRISPKKSWEGFAAGVLACVAVWIVLPGALGAQLTPFAAGLTGVSVALASVIGDLFESRLKREVGVKDSGTLLPGHGGFLDRIDSLLFAGLVAYWVLLWAGAR